MTTTSRHDKIMVAVGWLMASMLVLIPLAVTPDLIDRYRVVKESLARAQGIVGGLMLVVGATIGGGERFRVLLRERAVAIVMAAGVFWALLTTLLSTHSAHSSDSLATFLTSVLVCLCAWYASPRVPLLALDLLVPAVLINVVLLALQEYGVYQPFLPGSQRIPHHLSSTALLGNPNIVGTYMGLVAVVFAATATRTAGRRRWWQGFGAVCAVVGVIVSQTRTAMIALIVGLLIIAVGRSWKRAALAVAAVVVLLVLGAAFRLPVVRRLLEVPRLASTAGLGYATSGRVLPIAVGAAILADHPLTGAGPGTFKYHYMPYASRATAERPELLRGSLSRNFAEAHNDHIQLLAETGVPGYLLFLAAVVAVVQTTRRADRQNARQEVAHGIAFPLAATLLILCLAQFPLYVPVTRHLVVTMAGLLIGWSRTTE